MFTLISILLTSKTSNCDPSRAKLLSLEIVDDVNKNKVFQDKSFKESSLFSGREVM